MNTFEIQVDTKLDNSTIINIGRSIKTLYGKEALNGKNIAQHSTVKNKFGVLHKYRFQLELPIDEEMAEALVSLLYNNIDENFEVEFEFQDDELDCIECEEETITEAAKHDMWLKEQTKKGWRYGIEFSESNKTDPKMRPFYMLTNAQKIMGK